MLTLLPDHFVLEEVTRNDLIIASTAWGFTLGIGWLTTWSAIQQTMGVYRRHGLGVFRNAYAIMIWGEIIVCLSFGIICFMYILGIIPPRYVPLFPVPETQRNGKYIQSANYRTKQLCLLLLHP